MSYLGAWISYIGIQLTMCLSISDEPKKLDMNVIIRMLHITIIGQILYVAIIIN